MKLSKREKILLLILFLSILAAVYYKFIIEHQINKIADLKKTVNIYRIKKEKVEKELAIATNKNIDYKILNEKIINLSSKLLPEMFQEKIIVSLDEMIRKSRISVNIMNFSGPEVNILQGREKTKKNEDYLIKKLVDEFYGVNKTSENKKTDNNDNKTDNKVEKMTMDIFFNGEYKNLTDFIELIENYNKKLLIKNLNIIRDSNNKISGNIRIEYFAIPLLNIIHDDFTNWEYEGNFGKSNPFYSNTINEKRVQTDDYDSLSYDFVMSIKPYNSDLPTIMLGKTKDIERKTYVYADNPSVENVEIYFSEIDGEYFYKYKTTRDSYPRDFNEWIKFKPLNNTINIIIYTHKRNSAKDMSGANIKIYNETNKHIFVKIEGDDKIRPRVNVTGKSGLVEVVRD